MEQRFFSSAAAAAATGAKIVAVAVIAAGATPAATAGYVLSAAVAGGDSIELAPGESFSIEMMLESDAGDAHNSSIFGLLFTEVGLLYQGYTWQAPYENQTAFDFSTPSWNELPAVIDADTLPGPFIDIELSNVVPSGTFSSGMLVTLDLQVPADWTAATTIFVLPTVDTFANGFEVLEAETGAALSLIIIPAPGAALAVVVGAALLGCRRRRL